MLLSVSTLRMRVDCGWGRLLDYAGHLWATCHLFSVEEYNYIKSNTCILLFQIVKKKCAYAHWLCIPKCLDGNRPSDKTKSVRFVNTCQQQNLKSLIVKCFNTVHITQSLKF